MTNCPRDGHQLRPQSGLAGSVWACGFCSGAFVTQPTPLSQSKLVITSLREEWDVEVCCPFYGTTMRLVKLDQVALDLCPACGGLWLDSGEIEQVLGYLPQEQLAAYRSAWQSAKRAAAEVDIVSPLLGAALGVLVDGL